MMVLEHNHPLKLVDLELEHPYNKEEEEDEEEEEEENDGLNVKEEFRCICARCDQDISEYHKYYYKCIDLCNYSLHKFCAEAPKTLEHTSHRPHPLTLTIKWYDGKCNVCRNDFKLDEVIYQCSRMCYMAQLHLKCALDAKEKVLHHPSHLHALVCNISKPILCDCNACGTEHKGIFYSCILCSNFTIHSDCAFLTKKLLIQEATKNDFHHTHPLTLSYSFPFTDQSRYFYPHCKVCGINFFRNHNLWIYKCEKCRYFVHLNCATSRREPFMSIISSPGLGKLIKNYQDSDHPNLLHLPFPDQSYSIPKHLLHKQVGYKITESGDKVSIKHDSHEHPLILVKNDDSTLSTSSKIYSISCHDPMKRIELLCNGCLRPITSTPFYMCANKEQRQCNFVLHEWCTRLPTEIKNHPEHNYHTLILITNRPKFFFNVFRCYTCGLTCNGFAYGCIQCEFITDVSCALLPEKITHDAHPNHLLSRVTLERSHNFCNMCGHLFDILSSKLSFSCNICDFHLHLKCAYLCPRSIRHKIDKHPLELSYVPIENHKSDYFCEICETEFNPQIWFYHCHKCAQSMHTDCVSLTLEYEKTIFFHRLVKYGVHPYLNVKFEGTYTLECHMHPLSFVQGIKSDGKCVECHKSLMNQMIFKCGACDDYAIDFECCERLSNSEIPPRKFR